MTPAARGGRGGRGLEVAAALVAVLAVGWVWRRVPRVYFFADDLICLFKIATRGALRFVFEPFAGHVLVARNAVLAATYAAFGFRPEPFQWSALLVHLANVVLLLRVVRRCTGSVALGLLAALLWGACPLHAGTLGWYSVFGQVMGVCATLVVLDRAVAAATGESAPLGPRTALWIAAALLLATTSFGTGFATALAAPVLLFGFDPQAWRSRTVRWIVLAIPLLAAATFVSLHGAWIALVGQSAADRIVAARTAHADPRVALEMLFRMLVSGSSALLLGFAEPTPRAPQAAGWIAAAVFAGLAVAGVLRANARARLSLLASLAVAVAVDAAIAWSRSGIYVAFGHDLPTAAAQARYHYASSALLAVALAIALDALLGGHSSRLPCIAAPRRAWGAVALVAGTAAALYGASGFTLETRWVHRGWVNDVFGEIERRRAETPQGEPFFVENLPVPPWLLGPAFEHPSFPGVAALWLVRFPGPAAAAGEPHFVEENQWLTRIVAGLAAEHPRLATLLVTPEVAAGHPVARLPEAERATRAFQRRAPGAASAGGALAAQPAPVKDGEPR